MRVRNRKQFLTAVTAGSAMLALGARDPAAVQAQPEPEPAHEPPTDGEPRPAVVAEASPGSPPPAGGASPSPAPKKPASQAARAIAETMRKFDPKLDDAQIDRIAHDIDDDNSAGARLNPKKKRLRNWDEPVTAFELPE